VVEHAQCQRQRVRGVAVVVDHENAAHLFRVRCHQRRRGGRRGGDGKRCRARQRQIHDERTAFAGAVALRADLAAVHFHQLPHQRQADTQAAARALERSVGLHEEFEDLVEQMRRNADALVADAHANDVAFHRCLEPDAAIELAVLAGVVEKIGEHLRQALGIGVEVMLARRQIHHQVLAGVVDGRARGLDGVIEHGAQHHAPLAHLQAPARDARDVEQIIDQAHQLAQLALHDVHRVGGRSAVADLQQSQRVANRRERVAQFVRKGGEEFVLAPIGVAQAFFGATALGDFALQVGIGVGEVAIGAFERVVERAQFQRLFGLQCGIGVRELVVGDFEMAVEALQLAALPEQLAQHRDFRTQDLRYHRHEHVVHCAEVVAADAVQIGDVHGGHEDDRRLFVARMLMDEAGRLEAVHARHVDVEQDDGEFHFHQARQRLRAGRGAHHVFAEFAQDRFVAEQAAGLIVDEQDVDHQRCSHWRRVASSWSVCTGLAM
jgi:hypothetical protein